MEKLLSRKSEFIRHIRSLCSDIDYRYCCGEFVCDGIKLLNEALHFNAQVSSVLWKEKPGCLSLPDSITQYYASEDVFDFASPLKNSPGPLFTVKIKPTADVIPQGGVIVLDGVQDPGNVGTVIRTANAFEIGTVILTGDCADLYNPKTVRSTMGAVFRQNVVTLNYLELKALLTKLSLPLYGAALSDKSEDIRSVTSANAAYAIGSEGKGLSDSILNMCDRLVIIPMNPDSESLNAAVAASVIMWEISRREL